MDTRIRQRQVAANLGYDEINRHWWDYDWGAEPTGGTVRAEQADTASEFSIVRAE
jgi:hypothetical protein